MHRVSIAILLVICLISVGCIGKVQWVQRKGGDPEQMSWVPICPYCKHVVDFDTVQCSNPQCRHLLRWKKKTIYCDKLYLEEAASTQQEVDEQPQQPPVNKKPKQHTSGQPTQQPKDLQPRQQVIKEKKLPQRTQKIEQTPKQIDKREKSEKIEKAPKKEKQKVKEKDENINEWDFESAVDDE